LTSLVCPICTEVQGRRLAVFYYDNAVIGPPVQ